MNRIDMATGDHLHEIEAIRRAVRPAHRLEQMHAQILRRHLQDFRFRRKLLHERSDLIRVHLASLNTG
jgi:hypothetical protein